MEEELEGLEDAGCFEIEVLPDGANAIPAKWVFTVKTDRLLRETGKVQGQIGGWWAQAVRGD